MKKVLFVCTGNSCRSVMAEGLFRQMVEDRADDFMVASAGISAIEGFPATEETIRAMDEEGIDVSRHQSQRLSIGLISEADKIYVMEHMHKDYILSLYPQAAEKVSLLSDQDQGIPDPIRMSPSVYKSTLEIIKQHVKRIVEEL